MRGPRAALFAGRPSMPSRDGLTGAGLVVSVVVGLVSVVGVSASCVGGPRRSFDGSIYRDGAIAFQVPPAPEEWRAVHVTEGSLAYRDDAHGASILVNARCHRPDEATPLLALTNHLLMGATARDVGTQETVPFDGREALHTKLRARWDGVALSFDIYVMKKDGCSYDFVYMGDEDGYEAGTRAFETFVRGFHTLPGSGLVQGPRG